MTNEQAKEKNAIVAASMKIGETGLEPATLAEAKLLAETFISSGLIPRSFDTPAKVIVAYQAGREMGMTFWESLTKLYVVNGRVGMESKSMKGKALKSGKCKLWKEQKIGEAGQLTEGYRITIKRDDGTGGQIEFTVQEAQDAGLLNKDTYKKYLDDMLWNRATSKACRRWFEDVLYGVYTPDELMGIPPEQAYDPTTPRRGEREAKPVESKAVEIESNETELQLLIDTIEAKILADYGCNIDQKQMLEILTILSGQDDDPKFGLDADKPSNEWPVEYIQRLQRTVEERPLSAEIQVVCGIEPAKEGSQDTPQTENVNPDEGEKTKPPKIDKRKNYFCKYCAQNTDGDGKVKGDKCEIIDGKICCNECGNEVEGIEK